MNIKIRITLIVIVLCCASMICHAQQNHTISFSYDSDGNRISREILIQRIDKNQGETEMKPSTATDFFKTTTIELFPNPAGDQFMVEIKNMETDVLVHACLTNASGSVLHEKTIKSPLEAFDISGLASGIYFLRLTADNETHVWKVIKK